MLRIIKHFPRVYLIRIKLRMSNPRIERGDITTHNVNLLKLINQKVFPVNYNVR